MTLPGNVGYGTVTWHALAATGDSADPDSAPDGVPLVGLAVTFRASVQVCKNPTADPPVTILLQTVQATTDASGQLVDAVTGAPGVVLVATDDEDLQPHGWTWTATIQSAQVSPITCTFALPAGGTVDLTTVVPVASNPGESLSAWLAAVAQAEAARDAAVLSAASAAASSAGMVLGPVTENGLTFDLSGVTASPASVIATFTGGAEDNTEVLFVMPSIPDGQTRTLYLFLNQVDVDHEVIIRMPYPYGILTVAAHTLNYFRYYGYGLAGVTYWNKLGEILDG